MYIVYFLPTCPNRRIEDSPNRSRITKQNKMSKNLISKYGKSNASYTECVLSQKEYNYIQSIL